MAGRLFASRCLIHGRATEPSETARHHTASICETDAYGAEGLRVRFNARPGISARILQRRQDGYKDTKKKTAYIRAAFLRRGMKL